MTSALIVIYQHDLWLVLGTLVGFLILVFFVLMAISIAENVIALRKQVNALLTAQQQGVPVTFEADENEADEGPYKLLRIVAISAAVTLLIVVVRPVF